MARVLKRSHSFTCKRHTHPQRNEPYLPLPSQPKLVLIYWPWRDERLSWPCSSDAYPVYVVLNVTVNWYNYKCKYKPYTKIIIIYKIQQILTIGRLFLTIVTIHSLNTLLTRVIHDERPHSVLRIRWLWSAPDKLTLRSTVSIPTTLVFIGLGYFLSAARTTVSHGWLQTADQAK